MENKEAPVGLKTISFLYYLGSIAAVIWAVIIIFFGQALELFSSGVPSTPLLTTLLTFLFILDLISFSISGLILAIVFVSAFAFVLGGIPLYFGAAALIGLGVFTFFIGRGLWKGKEWARVLALVLIFLNVPLALFSTMSSSSFLSGISISAFTTVGKLAISVVIIWYLFRKKTREFFGK